MTKVNRTALNAKMDVPLARFGPLLWTRRPRQLPNSLGVRGQPLLCGLWRSAGPTLGNACVWRKVSCSLSTATAEPEGATTEPGGADPLKGTVVKACLGRNFPWCTTQACYVHACMHANHFNWQHWQAPRKAHRPLDSQTRPVCMAGVGPFGTFSLRSHKMSQGLNGARMPRWSPHTCYFRAVGASTIVHGRWYSMLRVPSNNVLHDSKYLSEANSPHYLASSIS